VSNFLQPSFEASRYFGETEPDGLLIFGLVLSSVLSIVGIAVAYRIWVQRPGTAARIRERFALPYRVLVNKYYWDEAYQFAIVRPLAATGRFFVQTFERVVVDGVFVGGATGVVRAGSDVVRGLQNGFLRYYAALLLIGVAGVSLYFLLSSS
jgi:NADH-quinone oxidoreductase subunit L